MRLNTWNVFLLSTCSHYALCSTGSTKLLHMLTTVQGCTHRTVHSMLRASLRDFPGGTVPIYEYCTSRLNIELGEI